MSAKEVGSSGYDRLAKVTFHERALEMAHANQNENTVCQQIAFGHSADTWQFGDLELFFF